MRFTENHAEITPTRAKGHLRQSTDRLRYLFKGNEEDGMASTAQTCTSGLNASSSTAPAVVMRPCTHVITPEAGHALEILGHAIEYLSDEFIHDAAAIEHPKGRIEAIQLLMAFNRQIYFSCPVRHTLGDRLRALGSRFLSFHHWS